MSQFNEARLDSACAEIQSQYDPAYQAQGLRAPPRCFGESVTDYEIRLAKPLQCHATEPIGKAPLQEMKAAGILHVARDAIIRDAMAAATRNEGPLRSITRLDETNRPIKEFYGRPGSVWDRFKLPTRFVKRFGGSPPCF